MKAIVYLNPVLHTKDTLALLGENIVQAINDRKVSNVKVFNHIFNPRLRTKYQSVKDKPDQLFILYTHSASIEFTISAYEVYDANIYLDFLMGTQDKNTEEFKSLEELRFFLATINTNIQATLTNEGVKALLTILDKHAQYLKTFPKLRCFTSFLTTVLTTAEVEDAIVDFNLLH